MSALAGVCNWNQQPIDPSVAAALDAHSRVRGPDASASVSPHPWLHLQSHVTHFDQLSKTERQPVTLADGSVVTLDGRLDNRDDLLLRLVGKGGGDLSDAALVAAAYMRWGMDSLPELIGDWCVAIWDASKRRMVLARDYAGSRPLHYLHRPNLFAWATSLEALIFGFRLTTPDDDFVAGRFLAVGGRTEVTPYVGVRMLRSAHVLTSEANSDLKIRRYWSFSAQPVVYGNQSEYIEHLRALLADAVRVRLRSSRTVWSHLSGGLDSSSVVCLAHRLISSGTVEAPAVQPLTWKTDSPEVGEEDRVAAVERWCGLKTVWTPLTGYRSADSMFVEDDRWYPSGWRLPTHENEAIAAGDYVVLTGMAGDVVMLNLWAARLELLDLLHRGHFVEFVNRCTAVAKAMRRPLWWVFKRIQDARRIGADQMRPDGGRQPNRGPRLVGVTPRLAGLGVERRSYRSLVRDFSSIRKPLALTFYGEVEGPRLGTHFTPALSRTHPYLHRPLTQFVLAVPPLSLWNHLTNRAGMKAALVDVIPPEIHSRTDKTFSPAAQERWEARRTDDLDSFKHTLGQAGRWEVVKRGYVRAEVLADGLTQPVVKDGQMRHFLMTCVDIEMWLRTLARHSVTVHDNTTTASAVGAGSFPAPHPSVT